MEQLFLTQKVKRGYNYNRIALYLLIINVYVYYGKLWLLLTLVLMFIMGIFLISGLLWYLCSSKKIFDLFDINYRKIKFPSQVCNCEHLFLLLYGCNFLFLLDTDVKRKLENFLNKYLVVFFIVYK